MFKISLWKENQNLPSSHYTCSYQCSHHIHMEIKLQESVLLYNVNLYTHKVFWSLAHQMKICHFSRYNCFMKLSKKLKIFTFFNVKNNPIDCEKKWCYFLLIITRDNFILVAAFPFWKWLCNLTPNEWHMIYSLSLPHKWNLEFPIS